MALMAMDELWAQMLTAMRQQGECIIKNVGITLYLEGVPEYVYYAGLRDRLDNMGRFRRWLSWRLRRQVERARWRSHAAILDNVLRQGQREGEVGDGG